MFTFFSSTVVRFLGTIIFFYNRDWRDVKVEEFIDQLDEYLHWYSEKRIKISLGGMSPIEYRRSLGLCG